MKYCLRCGKIIADNSMFKDRVTCSKCNIPFEEDDMTGKKFESLPEFQKQQYADELFKKIKSSPIFDKELFNSNLKTYGEASLYHCWWFDKYEKLGGRFSARYETEEQCKQRMEENYGKNSLAYQQAVAQQYIDKAGAEKESNQVKCPYCKSTNVHKISTTAKVTNTVLFGIFGAVDDAGKTYKCDSCGCKF